MDTEDEELRPKAEAELKILRHTISDEGAQMGGMRLTACTVTSSTDLYSILEAQESGTKYENQAV